MHLKLVLTINSLKFVNSNLNTLLSICAHLFLLLDAIIYFVFSPFTLSPTLLPSCSSWRKLNCKYCTDVPCLCFSVTWAQLILQAFRRFTYVTAHFPTLPSLYLRHTSFSNPSVASRTSQLVLQPLFRFYYVTGISLTSPGEPPNGNTQNPLF